MAEPMELRGSAPYYDGQIIAMKDKNGNITYHKITFRSGGGYDTSPISKEEAQVVAQQNFDRLSNYDLKTGDAYGVRMVYVKPPADKPVPENNDSGYTVDPIKSGVDYTQAVENLKPVTVAPVTRQQTSTPNTTFKVNPMDVANQPLRIPTTSTRSTTTQTATTPNSDTRAKVLESYKRAVESAPTSYQSRRNTAIDKPVDYVFNLEKPKIPDSRNKLMEMAIARRNSLGSAVPSQKVGGPYGI